MLQLLSKTRAIRRSIPGALSARRTFADEPTDSDNKRPDVGEKAAPKAAPKSADAGQSRLNELLASLSKDSNLDLVRTVVATKPINRSKPKSARPSPTTAGAESNDNDDDDDSAKLVQAVKSVAAELGGDARRTESELLQKLLNRTGPSSATGGEAAAANINDLIAGMQIDRMDGAKRQPTTRSQYVRKSIAGAQERRSAATGAGGRDGDFGSSQQQQQQQRSNVGRRQPQPVAATEIVSVNLFGERPLGIFAEATQLRRSDDVLDTWQRLHRRELTLAVTHPPSNHFQKMALWTEQGKLWRFPIDNEQGLDDEARVCFTEHIFLDGHLDGWCPTRGPVRHFMELVCVGLSKNPYYTVQQKIDHIDWFREYFAGKRDILEQVIVEQKTSEVRVEAQ